MTSNSAQFSAGVVFALATLGILVMAFKHKGTLQTMHYDIVHFMCAFCAGAAGAFFTGSALLSVDSQVTPGTRLVFQGTAGVALFTLVFLVFRFRFNPVSVAPPPAPVAPAPASIAGSQQSWISVGTNTPFSQAAEALAEESGGTINLSQLTPDELAVIPRSERLACGTLADAQLSLERLGTLVPEGSVRKYTVALNLSTKRFVLEI